MATFSDMRHEPSILDLAVVSHAPGGASVYSFPTPEQVAADRAGREQHAAAHAAVQAERNRMDLIEGRVRAFIASPPADDGTAAGRLLMHLDWSIACQRQAETAAGRAGETQEALTRLDVARSELAVLKQSVRLSYEDWTRFGGTGGRPATRLREQAALHDEIVSLEAPAFVADVAAFESTVACACVQALALMLPLRRAEALAEREAPGIISTIAAAAAVIQDAINTLAALDEAGRPDWETAHALDLVGVKPPGRLVREGATVQFPRFAGAPADIVARVDAAALERYRAALPDLAGDLAALPVDGQPSAPAGRKSIAATIRSFIGKEST